MQEEDFPKLTPLTRVRHAIFGVGYVVDRGSWGGTSTVKVAFENHGTKELTLAFAGPKLELLP